MPLELDPFPCRGSAADALPRIALLVAGVTAEAEVRRPDERRLCPPRLVSVYDGDCWVPEQLLGWRRVSGRCRCLVRPAKSVGYLTGPARWVDAGMVRPRGAEGTEPPTVAAGSARTSDAVDLSQGA